MKRASVLLVVVLLAMLVIPTAVPSAKVHVPGTDGDTPSVQIITPQSDNPGPGNTAEDGDGDGIAGLRDGTKPIGSNAGVGVPVFFGWSQAWWNYLVFQVRTAF